MLEKKIPPPTPARIWTRNLSITSLALSTTSYSGSWDSLLVRYKKKAHCKPTQQEHLPSLAAPVLNVPTRFFLSAFSLPSTVLCSSSVWLSSSSPRGWRVMPRATRIWNSLQAQSLFVQLNALKKLFLKSTNFFFFLKKKKRHTQHTHVYTLPSNYKQLQHSHAYWSL